MLRTPDRTAAGAPGARPRSRRGGRGPATLLDFLCLDPAPLLAPARRTRRPPTAGPDPLPRARELLAGTLDGDTPRLLAATGWSRAW
ncbi:hypothetical protein [uncultured Pseudokineococcus sp.]|uniref:hypothetical protein n=1 Tax=uncultured Pseudokineococcus sp. TaxID=1642928 RepID=UPI00261F687C|nr:hypothetical protein [uncultured Pseudokineococcus sp.]